MLHRPPRTVRAYRALSPIGIALGVIAAALLLASSRIGVVRPAHAAKCEVSATYAGTQYGPFEIDVLLCDGTSFCPTSGTAEVTKTDSGQCCWRVRGHFPSSSPFSSMNKALQGCLPGQAGSIQCHNVTAQLACKANSSGGSGGAGTSVPSIGSSASVGSSGSGSNCFAHDALVRMADGSSKRMRDVRVDDVVATTRAHDDSTSGAATASRVYAFADRVEDGHGEYIRIRTDSGALEVTPEHLVFAAPASAPSSTSSSTMAPFRAVRARTLVPGARLLRRNHAGTASRDATSSAVRVQRVQRVTRRGAYAPLTEHGTLFVDDHLASCYAHHDSHGAAHAAFAPLRLASRLMRVRAAHAARPTGTHWYARILMAVRRAAQGVS